MEAPVIPPSGPIAQIALAPQNPTSTALVAAEAREKATVFIAAELASRNPRDERNAQKAMQESCRNLTLATKAEFSFPRGGERISGPTVVLMRELARCWGNLRYGFEIVASTPSRLRIIGWAWDMNPGSNTYVQYPDEFELVVQRKDKRTGETVYRDADERDVRELLNKRGAICVRNALKSLIPPQMIEEALERCAATKSSGDHERLQKDRPAVVAKLRKGWAKKNVTEEMLVRHLGCKIEAITGEQLVELREIWEAIEEGTTSVEEQFPAPAEAPAAAKPAVADTATTVPHPLPETEIQF